MHKTNESEESNKAPTVENGNCMYIKSLLSKNLTGQRLVQKKNLRLHLSGALSALDSNKLRQDWHCQIVILNTSAKLDTQCNNNKNNLYPMLKNQLISCLEAFA